MKKWLVLLLLGVAVFAALNRQRLFVRDPLGSVSRSGVHEDGAQVFINYSNDVLLENDRPPMYLNVLLHGEPPSSPDKLACFHYLLCLANGSPLPRHTALPGARLEEVTARQVRFLDQGGREVVISLR